MVMANARDVFFGFLFGTKLAALASGARRRWDGQPRHTDLPLPAPVTDQHGYRDSVDFGRSVSVFV
jgi:hypothetical protein